MKKAQVKKIIKNLKTVTDDTRLKVVLALRGKRINVGRMNKTLKVEPSLLSHHLKVLKDAGIVKAERVGKQVYYSLPRDVFSDVENRIHLNCVTVLF